MRFDRIRRLGAGAAADPDPRGNAATVASIPDEALLAVPFGLRNTDAPVGQVKAALEGTAANTCSVELWVLDDEGLDRGAGMPEPLTVAQKADRKFYRLAAAVVVTVGQIVNLGQAVPGTMYLRVTVAPAAAGVLKVGVAGG